MDMGVVCRFFSMFLAFSLYKDIQVKKDFVNLNLFVEHPGMYINDVLMKFGITHIRTSLID